MQDDLSDILNGLNDAQRQAVTLPPGGALILAGAGSGKTRVLVHRIAWLIGVEGASEWNILAVTFTNKAARELRQRIEPLLGRALGGMWVGTFHGLTHRFLRYHGQEARLPQNFQVMDSEDQQRLIKRLLRTLELDETRWPVRQIQGFINARKDRGERARHLDPGHDRFQQTMVQIYQEYEAACERGGMVDFGELLLRTHELLRDNPELLHHYQQRFTHLLVDEFQDTNEIQYAWLRLLAGAQNRIFAVGDDDQSIYGWRGARIENIRDLQRHHPTMPLIRLEQNYRSTATILEAANCLIAHNPSRLGKNLWTDGSKGEPIQLYTAFDEIDEARFVVEQIAEQVENGKRRSDAAILYRSNAQSRQFEEQLMQRSIPYRVYGGLRFFERAEIRDALAYLRLLCNRNDDGAFERAVNHPPRGIGNRTLEQLRSSARSAGLSLWRAGETLLANGTLSKRAANALQGFFTLIDEAQQSSAQLSPGQQVEQLINASGLRDHFRNSKDGKAEDRLENLAELIGAVQQFTQEAEEEEPLPNFLAHAALEAGEGQGDPEQECVQLMTLHSAKGLEFPLVFITGLEEGLFPSGQATEEEGRLEEERRLCYVGMTRAMEQLYLTHAELRRLWGRENHALPSRFLREIPPQLLHVIRSGPRFSPSGYRRPPPTPPSTAAPAGSEAGAGLRIGQRVHHPRFGHGVITSHEGSGERARVQVKFEKLGYKWLMLQFAGLEGL